MRRDTLGRLFAVTMLMPCAAWAVGNITSLNASVIGLSQPTPAVNGITSGTPGNAFLLYLNGTFNPLNAIAVTWFDGGTTTTLSPSNVTPTVVTVAVPASLYAALVDSPIPITITEVENGTILSNTATFFVNPPLTPGPSVFVASVGPPLNLSLLTGGTQPYQIVPGTLPPGTNISSTANGVALTGQATAPGVSVLTPHITDFWQNSVTLTQILQLVAPATLTAPLSPASAVAGSGTFTLTVNGNNFVQNLPSSEVQGSFVQWSFGSNDPVQLTTTFVSVNQLQAIVPSTLLLSQGTAFVSVVQPDSTVSNALPFNILGPAITSLSPTSVAAGSAAFPLSVNGAQFLPGAVVFFNGSQLSTTFVSSGLLTVTVPPNLVTTAGFVPVLVENPGGTNSNVVNFFVAPTITSISPPSAVIGSPQFTLTVNGTQFQPGSVVFLNTTGLTTTFVNSSQLTAIVPTNLVNTAGALPVTVSIVGGFSNPVNFIVTPKITSLTPPSAGVTSGGISLVVNGAGFLPGGSVTFNGVSVLSSVINSSQVNAAIPSNLLGAAGVFPVVVNNGNGLGASAPFNFTVNPAILSLSPSNTFARSTPLPLSVTGVGFEQGAVISFNGVALTTSFPSSGLLTATIPAAQLAAGGNFRVIVTNPDGGVSAPSLLFINPTITSVTPTGAAALSGATPLIVTGLGFEPGAVIDLNGVELTTTVTGSTRLNAIVPPNLLTAAGAFPVVAANPDEGVSAPASFIVTPTILSLAPASVLTGTANFTLVVSGATFVAGSVVSLNGTALSTTFVNSGQLTAAVPSSLVATVGNFPVTVTNPNIGSSAPVNLVVTNNPTVTALSPSSAAAGSAAFTLSVTGVGFQAGAIVSFQGTSLTTTFSSSTLLTAAVPATLLASSGSFPVIVTNPDGGLSAPVNFVVNPVITNLSPASVAAGSPAFTLSVTGTTFVASLPSTSSNLQSIVSFNGVSLPTTVVNPRLLTVTVPANLVTTVGTFPVVVTNPGNSVSAPATFTVISSLSIATTSLGSGQAGVLFTTTLVGRGGTPPYTWTAAGLPSALGITPSTGVIAGIPLQSGTSTVNVTLRDSLGASVGAQFPLVITAPAVTISTGGLPNGTVGVPYVGTIGATGGSGSYSFSLGGGKLPDGLSLSSDGTVKGTPQTPGTFTFSVNVTDSTGAGTGRDFTVTIAPAPLVVTGAPPPSGGTSGVPVSVSFGGTGGVPPYKCSTSGTLPPGTTFANCTLSGTPSAPGTYTFVVTVTDSTGVVANKSISITIAPPGLVLTATGANGQVGVAYSGQLTATGGTPPYSYGASGLPDGLSLSSSSGAITGTPTTAGQFSIAGSASDATGAKANTTLTVTIIPATLAIATASLPDGTVNSPYSASLSASGGAPPYTFAISGLPDGLTGHADGTITGTPSVAGKFTVSATVTDSAKATASQRYTVTIAGPAITITTSSLPVATVGAAYSAAVVATGGIPPLTWSATGLPTGLAISPTGAISGTAGAPGSSTVTVTVKDSLGTTASKTLPLSVVLPPAPPLTYSGVLSASPPAQQPQLQVSLGTVYPVDVVVTLTLTFAPDSGGDDPSIQFSTGGRTAKVTVPAGSTLASTTVGLQTGTVAGLITITSQLQAVGQDVTPTPPPATTTRIAPLAPVPTTLTAARTSTGFNVTVIGYVTDREVTQAIFTFTAAPGSNLQTTSLTVPVDTLFAAYFSGSTAIPFGGQFNFSQAFTINGNPQAVVSVTVTLVNKIGQSPAMTLNLN